jgi:hypothetical protein
VGFRQLGAREGLSKCKVAENFDGFGIGRKAMKILNVVPNNRKHTFEVRTRRQTLSFPYARVVPTPSPNDRLSNVFVDPDLGNERFTYTLESGAEGSVHIDEVLEYSGDPSYMAELMLYRLSQDAKARFESSGISVRQMSEKLGTSPTQMYRLLDPTNYSKSLRQLISLLYMLDCEVEVEVRERPGQHLAS